MSNLVRKIEKIIKPWTIVLGFVALMMLGFCHEARSEVTAEIGAGFLSGQYSKGQTGIITERWGGPYGSRYAVGMGVISRQEVTDRSRTHYKMRSNLFVFAQRRVSFNLKGCTWDCISLGLGPAYFNATNRAIGSNFAAALSIEFRPTERLGLNIRHFSNAGSKPPNMGQDMLTLTYTF